MIFWGKIVPNWVYFGQREDLKLTTELSQKIHYCRNQAIKNGLNEAILLMSINEALLLLSILKQSLIHPLFIVQLSISQ